MEFLAMFFVSRPLNILMVAAALVAVHLFLKFGAPAKSKSADPFLFAAAAWLFYAGWEWFVMIKSPEAGIRIDLLIIWPILGLIMIWAIFRFFR